LISGKRLEQVYSPQAKPDLELRELVGVTITSSSDLSRWFTSWSIKSLAFDRKLKPNENRMGSPQKVPNAFSAKL